MRLGAPRSLALVASLAFGLLGCDAITGGKDPSITLALADNAVSLGQSGQATVAVTITRTNFDKPVVLSVSGEPIGVSATFTPTTIQTGSSSTMTIVVAGTTAPGTSTLTVAANGEGLTEKTATVDLTVSITGSFSLSSFASTVTAAQGGGASSTILVQRTGGHADNVALDVTGLPTGATATFASPTTATTELLQFTVPGTVAVGSYPITVTGSATGLTNQPTTVTLNVIAPPATASITLPYCSNSVPNWFAYQNEGYAWVRLLPTGSSFTFNATQKVAVARVFIFNDANSNETQLQIDYADRTELSAQTDADCPGSKSLTGTIAGATSGQSARVSFGGARATPTAAAPDFSLSAVADRTLDLVATKGSIAATSQNTEAVTPDKIIVRRSLNPAGGSALPALDFNAGEAFAPVSTQLTVANQAGGEATNIRTRLITPNSTRGVIHNLQPTSSPFTLYSIPGAQLGGSDVHELLVESYQPGFLFGRIQLSYLGALTDRTETLAAALNTPSITVLTTSPFVRLRGQLTSQADYPTAAQFLWCQPCEFQSLSVQEHLVVIAVSSGYLGGTPSTWDITVPDFGTIAGFNSSWMLTTGSVLFEVDGYSATRGSVLYGATPIPGDVTKAAYRVFETNANLRSAPARALQQRRQYLRR